MQLPQGPRVFATTHWSVVVAARDSASPEAGQALEELCRKYWPPIYGFIRSRGHSTEDAQDLSQEFFARLIAKDYLRAADATKGKFRTLLLTAVTRFLINDWERSQTQKRGGKTVHLSIEECLAEEACWSEPADTTTPERIFQRCWAETLLRTVLARLREEVTGTASADRFEILKPFLTGDQDLPSATELAAKLGVTKSTIYSLVHRLRQRYGQLLREEIAQTVNSPEEIQDELRHLLTALSS